MRVLGHERGLPGRPRSMHRQVADGLCVQGFDLRDGGWRRAMLAVLSAAVCPRLEVCYILFRVLVEQCVFGGVRADLGGHGLCALVLQRAKRQGARLPIRGADRVPVPHRLGRAGIIHRSRRPVHTVLNEVLREASGGTKKQDHGIGFEGGPVLHLVLREMHQILEQKRLYPDCNQRQVVLSRGQEGILVDHEERAAIRHGCNVGLYDHPRRLRKHHHRHGRCWLLLGPSDAPRGFARDASGLLRHHGFHRLEDFHDCVPLGVRHINAVLPHRGGD
mmetsp:Transcript_75568/g.231215  ORF Transcript_75568/g.231215 Transcript_75568/m.231215 type:complete len:276 (-) Transcript_75568:292-1119(-)